MKYPAYDLACCLVFVAPARAAELIEIQDGPALAAYLTRLMPTEETSFEGTLNIISRQQGRRVVPFVSRIRLRDHSWEVTYETFPNGGASPERLTVVHSPSAPNVYYYSKTSGGQDAPPQELSGSQACVPFAQSDFWLADLGRDFFQWPTQRLLPPQMRKGRPCKVLESRPAATSPCPYGKVISWIDNENGAVILAEAYDKQDQRIKEFEVESVAKVDGQWQPQELKIQDLTNRSRTLLKFKLKEE